MGLKGLSESLLALLSRVMFCWLIRDSSSLITLS